MSDLDLYTRIEFLEGERDWRGCVSYWIGRCRDHLRDSHAPETARDNVNKRRSDDGNESRLLRRTR